MEELSIRKVDAIDSDFVFAVKKAAFREYVEQVEEWDDTHQRGLHNKRFDSPEFSHYPISRKRYWILLHILYC